ncbi:asparagine synthase-related protein [Paenisporosarcina macmurdoensis]|uniref:asparagine synthase (glutamine-hydrolyzing) n=1 Tax=Paenisporosarcina macmurdoensis TaxID=212659 RepID=A0ABW1L939_9BACL
MHIKLMETFNKDQVSKLLKKPTKNNTFNVDKQLHDYFYYIKDAEPVERMMYTDLKYALPNDMLVKTDRMSMLNSLEIRSPFLDHKIVEMAFNIPLQYKIIGTKRKIILKDTFSEFLPNEILNAKKRGFGIPLAEWFKSELKELLLSTLSKENVESANLVNYSVVSEIIIEHQNGKKNHANLLWSLVVLHKWYEKFMKSI